MAGDLVTDAGLVVVPPSDMGVVREVRGSLALVDWADGECAFEELGSLRRVAEGFENPLPDPSVWTPRPEAVVRIATAGGPIDVRCGVARTPEQKKAGLQPYAFLPKNTGLLFPYPSPERVSFHMGRVLFPIDIMFVQPSDDGGAGRVAKIVDDIKPGTSGSWGENKVLAVVEVPGGFCLEAGIEPGDVVKFADIREASSNDELYGISGEDRNLDAYNAPGVDPIAYNQDGGGVEPVGTDENNPEEVGNFGGRDPTEDGNFPHR